MKKLIQMRILVADQDGIAVHRAKEVTPANIKKMWWWKTIHVDVKKFVRSCLNNFSSAPGLSLIHI